MDRWLHTLATSKCRVRTGMVDVTVLTYLCHGDAWLKLIGHFASPADVIWGASNKAVTPPADLISSGSSRPLGDWCSVTVQTLSEHAEAARIVQTLATLSDALRLPWIPAGRAYLPVLRTGGLVIG